MLDTLHFAMASETPRARWTFNKDETPEVILNFGDSSREMRSIGAGLTVPANGETRTAQLDLMGGAIDRPSRFRL